MIITLKPKNIILDSIELQQFDGNMLGDGSLIFKTKGVGNPRYVHNSKYSEYLAWLHQNLAFMQGRPIWKRDYFDKRTEKVYSCYWSASLTFPEFLKQRNRWYRSGESRKQLPKDLKIDKTLLLHWYLDDGSLATKGGVYFAADDFTYKEVDELKGKIENFLGYQLGIHKNEKNFRIYIPKKNASNFFKLIGKCPVNCFSYKWCG
jgi:hypothetical protein